MGLLQAVYYYPNSTLSLPILLELVEMIDRPNHPWFLACQFHPEFTSNPRSGHPVFTGFIEAALRAQQGELPANVATL